MLQIEFILEIIFTLLQSVNIMVEPIFDYQFRLILIGDSTVGKSSLLKYFTDGKFAEVITTFFLGSFFFLIEIIILNSERVISLHCFVINNLYNFNIKSHLVLLYLTYNVDN